MSPSAKAQVLRVRALTLLNLKVPNILRVNTPSHVVLRMKLMSLAQASAPRSTMARNQLRRRPLEAANPPAPTGPHKEAEEALYVFRSCRSICLHSLTSHTSLQNLLLQALVSIIDYIRLRPCRPNNMIRSTLVTPHRTRLDLATISRVSRPRK